MILTSETRARLCDLLREYESTYVVPIRVEQLQLTRRRFTEGAVESERVFLEVEVTVTRPGNGSQRWLLSLDFDEMKAPPSEMFRIEISWLPSPVLALAASSS